mgnify:CR=1 FL=1
MKQAAPSASFYRSAPFWAAVVVAALALVAFAPSMRNGFVLLDDYTLVVDNPYVRLFHAKDLLPLFTTLQSEVDYIPVTTLSYVVERAVLGRSPAAVHFTNTALHVLCSVLVFVLLRRMLSAWILPAVAASLFAIHPVQVESVAWVSERKNVLSTVLLLLSFYLYTCSVQKKTGRGRWGAYGFAVFAFILAALAKPQALLLPLLMVLYRLSFTKTEWQQLALEVAPFVAIALPIGMVTIAGQQQAGSLPLQTAGYGPKLYGPSVIILRYLASFAFPIQQAPYQWPQSFHAVGAPFIALALLVSLVLVSAIVLLWNRQRVASFGLLWFVISLTFVLHLIRPLNVITADRHLYLASIGLAVAAGCALVSGVAAFRSNFAQLLARSVLLLFAITIFFLLRLTWSQTAVWRDSLTLYRHNLLVSPYDPRVRLGLGQAYAQFDDWEAAAEQFKKGANMEPLPELLRFLGIALHRIGNNKEAVEVLERLRAQDPDSKDRLTRLNLALAYSALRKHDEAAAILEEMLEAWPNDSPVRNALGVVYQKRGNALAALREFERAVALDPLNTEARTNYAKALAEKGDSERALEELEKAIQTDPTALEPRLELARYYERHAAFVDDRAKAAELDRKALEHYLALVHHHPQYPAHILRAIELFIALGDAEQAARLSHRAALMYPTDFPIRFNLGVYMLRARRPIDAIAHFEAALKLAPDEESRTRTLGNIELIRRELGAPKR